MQPDHAAPIIVQRVAAWFRARIAAGFASLLFAVPAASAGTVITLDGGVHEGEVSYDGAVTVRGAVFMRIDPRSVLLARFTDAAPSDQYQPGLLLTSGARIAGEFSSLAEKTVKIARKNFTIPTDDVAWAIYQPFGPALAGQAPRGKTGALLAGGDFFEGAIKSADATTAKVQNAVFGPRVFDTKRKEFHALILRDIKPQASVYEVTTKDGSRYPALDITGREPGWISLRNSVFDGLKLALPDVVEIRASASRCIDIAAVPPSKVVSGRERAFSPGVSLDGSPLLIAGKSAGRGFESAVGASVTWDLQGGGGTFIARVAPSARTSEKLVFTVFADKRSIFASSAIGAGDPPLNIRCAIPPAATLTLRIEGGSGTGVWGDPILLRR